MAPDSLPDPLRCAVMVGAILDRLAIPYVTAGSFASSVHGEPRSTDDVDIVADLRSHQVEPLARALGPEWYVSLETARDAVLHGASFNAIHVRAAVKVDLFVVGTDPFDAHRVATGSVTRVGPAAGDTLRVDTAEHTVLRKLEWFKRGGETSERQWRDVVGILRARRGTLDERELDTWAIRLGVPALLARARAAAAT